MTTKENIIDISIDLFSKNGYKGVSIRDITKQAGIRESSFYKHFASKNELLNIIFDIFLKSYNKDDLSDNELKEKIVNMDLLVFLKYAIENFFQKMDTQKLDKIFRILMNEQFRVEKARNIITNELINYPIKLYSIIFKEKLKDKFTDYNLISREFHYPLFTMAYQYSIMKFDENNKSSDIKKQMFEHIDFFYKNILTQK